MFTAKQKSQLNNLNVFFSRAVYEESILSVNKPMLRDTAYELSKLILYNL